MHYDDATERREEASASKSWNAERKDVATNPYGNDAEGTEEVKA